MTCNNYKDKRKNTYKNLAQIFNYIYINNNFVAKKLYENKYKKKKPNELINKFVNVCACVYVKNDYILNSSN